VLKLREKEKGHHGVGKLGTTQHWEPVQSLWRGKNKSIRIRSGGPYESHWGITASPTEPQCRSRELLTINPLTSRGKEKVTWWPSGINHDTCFEYSLGHQSLVLHDPSAREEKEKTGEQRSGLRGTGSKKKKKKLKPQPDAERGEKKTRTAPRDRKLRSPETPCSPKALVQGAGWPSYRSGGGYFAVIQKGKKREIPV